MAGQARQVDVAAFMREWLAMIRRHGPLMLAWYVPLGLGATMVDIAASAWLGTDGPGGSWWPAGTSIAMIIGGLAGMVVCYVVMQRAMEREGMVEAGRPMRIGALLVAATLGTLGMMAGFMALVVPGLILMARWSIYLPFIIADPDGRSGGLQDSWDATANSQGALTAVMLVLVAGQVGAAFAFSALYAVLVPGEPVPGLNQDYALMTLGENVISYLGSGFGLLLSLGIFALLVGSTRQLEGVFD